MYHKSSATGGVSVTAEQWATKMKDNNDALQGTKTFRYENKYKSVENTQFFIIVPELSVINLATRVPSKTFCWKNFFFHLFAEIFFPPRAWFQRHSCDDDYNGDDYDDDDDDEHKKKQHCEGFNRLMWFLFEVFSKGVVKLAFELLLAFPVESLYHIYLLKHVWHDADTYMQKTPQRKRESEYYSWLLGLKHSLEQTTNLI